MDRNQEKDIFKAALKSNIPAINTELGKALDFADKFIDAGNTFSELSPRMQQVVFSTLLSVMSMPHPFINEKYYKK